MSNAIKVKVNELFEAVKGLQSLEEIKPFCETFNEWVNLNCKLNKASLGTALSRAEFYKKFKSIKLEQGKNAELVPKYDAQGNVTGNELKHYVLNHCGLSKADWDERNTTNQVTDKLENSHEIDPEEYLEVTSKLLESNEPNEIAVGLIAATGRRPHEILVRAKFKAIAGENYQIMFEGQGKKRGEKPVFPIATLFPADYIIKRLNWFRSHPDTKEFIKGIAQESTEVSIQNIAIDNRRGNVLRRIVREYFSDKLAVRYGQENNDCKGLRAAYLCLATERDCRGATGTKLLHAARLAGHFVSATPTDRDLRNLITTLGYSDYYVLKPVEYVPTPVKSTDKNVKAYAEDLARLKELQTRLNLPNQKDVIRYLLELSDNEFISQKVKPEIPQTVTQREEVEKVVVDEKVEKETVNTKTVKRNIEVDSIPFSELKNMKSKDAFSEKMLRTYRAITEYNGQSPENKIAITNAVFRTVCGGNSITITNWMEAHKDEIISHNVRYGLGGKDDTQMLTMHNKSLGAEKIKQITESIIKKLNAED